MKNGHRVTDIHGDTFPRERHGGPRQVGINRNAAVSDALLAASALPEDSHDRRAGSGPI